MKSIIILGKDERMEKKHEEADIVVRFKEEVPSTTMEVLLPEKEAGEMSVNSFASHIFRLRTENNEI